MFADNITWQDKSKEEVFLFYRPKEAENPNGVLSKWQDYNDKYLTDQNVVKALKHLNEQFPELHLDTTHEYMENNADCFYSPHLRVIQRQAIKMQGYGHDWELKEHQQREKELAHQ